MKKIGFLTLTIFVIFLSACGGGGSSSGGPTNDNDGTFLGSSTITLTGQGESTTVTVDFELIIQNNILISVTSDGENGGIPVTLSVPITGSTFTFILEQPNPTMTGDGFICTASIGFAALISGDTITGEISGVQDCVLNGVTIPFETSGSFTTTRI